jgi:hypothetical protein
MPWRARIGLKLVAPPIQIAARTLIGMLAQATTAAITEYVGEEHVRIVAGGFEQHHILALELKTVAVHAGAHPRVDDGAESLRQDYRQPPVDEMLGSRRRVLVRWSFGRQARIEWHQRVDADDQFGTFVQCHGRVQGLDQRTIDEIPFADPDRREQARKGGTRLDSHRNRHVIMPR